MPPPSGHVRVGIYTGNADGDTARARWIPWASYVAFLGQVKTVLKNPSPVKTLLRARVDAMMGPGFEGETDQWVFMVCQLGHILACENQLTDAEYAQLRAEFGL